MSVIASTAAPSVVVRRSPDQHESPAPAMASVAPEPNLTVLLVLMGVALGLVIGANSSLSVAQPDIARALGSTQTQLTWVVNSYALAFAALLLPAGIATDKFGRRTALVLGLTVFGAASLASGWAGDSTTLILLRVVAGIGATLVMPATLSVLVDSFPPERRGFAVSVWAGITGAGALIGVLASGIMLNSFWWGSIEVLYGVGALLVVPAAFLVVPNVRNPALSLDPVGGLLSAAGLAGIVFGVIEGPDKGWDATSTLVGLFGGAVALVAFVVVELRSPDPMLDVRLFRSRGLATGSLLVMLMSLSLFGFFLVGPQYLQFIRGYDALGTALRLLPFAIGIGPASQLSPGLVERIGARWVATGGTALMAAGLTILSTSITSSYLVFAIGLVVTSSGMGLALPAGTTLIIDGLPADRRTLSSAVNDVTRELGSAVGAAAFGSLLLTIYRRQVDSTLGGLPADAAKSAHDGIAGAIAVSPSAWPLSRALVPASTNGFTAGFQSSMLVGAAILVGTAVVTALFAPTTAGVPVTAGPPVSGPPVPVAPAEPARPRRPRPARRAALAIGLVAALVGAGGGVHAYLSEADAFVSTDNAQVDGTQISINAPATGTLVGWHATLGAAVRRHMVVGRIKLQGGFVQPQMIILAPGDGVVSVDNGTEGSYVTTGTPLAIAYDPAGIYVTARVSESDIHGVTVGAPVEITVDALPGTVFDGAVMDVQGGAAGVFSPLVQSNTSGTFLKVAQYIAVRISLGDTHGRVLTPGMNAAVKITRR